MQREMLRITGEPSGIGQEHACYRHPHEDDKVFRIRRGNSEGQTRRDLERHGMDDYSRRPRFHGIADTSLGRGLVVDPVANLDGKVSGSPWWHFDRGHPVAGFAADLDELDRHLLEKTGSCQCRHGTLQCIVSKAFAGADAAVVIDGLGNHGAADWLDCIGFLARRKIDRRRRRFIGRLQNYSAGTMRAHRVDPRSLDSAYRRSGQT